MAKSSMTKRIAVFSDVHLAHNKTPTEHIVANLRTEINSRLEKEHFDAVFLAGDLFDYLIHLNDIRLASIIAWASSFLTICSVKGIALRILEGTPLHDRRQSKLFEHIKAILPKEIQDNLDLKYHGTMTIEHVKKLQMNVLYVPDNFTNSAEETFSLVKKELKNNNLDKVDLAIMHGMFEHQLEQVTDATVLKATHQSVNYLSIVKHYIFVGHHHEHSVFKRILVEGSFDRLKHGEEHPKGFLIAHLEDDPTQDTYYFIENKNAKVYKTITIKTKEIDRFNKDLQQVFSTLPDKSHLRLIVEKDNPIYLALDKIIDQYPQFHITKKLPKNKTKKEAKPLEKFMSSTLSINDKNIYSIVQNKVTKINVSDEIKNEALRIFKDMISSP